MYLSGKGKQNGCTKRCIDIKIKDISYILRILVHERKPVFSLFHSENSPTESSMLVIFCWEFRDCHNENCIKRLYLYNKRNYDN